MSAPVWLAFLAAAGVGAVTRYGTDRRLGFATGTLVVNVAGSFFLGLVTGFGLYHGLSSDTRIVIGTGFCGAFTTFSTFSLEVLTMVGSDRRRTVGRYVLASVAGGLGAAAAGLTLAAA